MKIKKIHVLAITEIIFVTICFMYSNISNLNSEIEIEIKRRDLFELYNYNRDELDDTQLIKEADQINKEISQLEAKRVSIIPAIILFCLLFLSIILVVYIFTNEE